MTDDIPQLQKSPQGYAAAERVVLVEKKSKKISENSLDKSNYLQYNTECITRAMRLTLLNCVSGFESHSLHQPEKENSSVNHEVLVKYLLGKI